MTEKKRVCIYRKEGLSVRVATAHRCRCGRSRNLGRKLALWRQGRADVGPQSSRDNKHPAKARRVLPQSDDTAPGARATRETDPCQAQRLSPRTRGDRGQVNACAIRRVMARDQSVLAVIALTIAADRQRLGVANPFSDRRSLDRRRMGHERLFNLTE